MVAAENPPGGRQDNQRSYLSPVFKYSPLAGVAALVLLFGCTPKPATRSPTDGSSVGSAQTKTPNNQEVKDGVVEPAAPLQAKLISGLYREEGGRGLFTPCAEPGEVYELSTPDSALASRYAEAILQGYPGQSVVIDLRGELLPGQLPTNRRTGQIVFSSLERIRAKNPRNTCIAYDFWGLGNEPFWSLQVSAAEAVAEFSLLGANTVRFAYAPPSIEQDGKITRYFFPGEQRLKATFTEAPCEDTMAGNPYAYSVVVEYNGKTYRGCASRP